MSERPIHDDEREPRFAAEPGATVLVQEPSDDSFHGNEDLAPTTPERRLLTARLAAATPGQPPGA